MKFSLPLLLLLGSVTLAQEPKKAYKPNYPADVKVEVGISYLPEGRTEKADLYLPKEMAKGRKYPAVVMIHGGGWTSGQRDASRELNVCGNLARAGYVAISIDYVLSANGKATWPQNLYDCKTAVRWLRQNADKYQIDAEHIGVIGGSAGGHLSAMVALTDKGDNLDPKEPFGDVSCKVSCGVDMYGPNDLSIGRDMPWLGKKLGEDAELYRKASPVTYARKSSVPMLILHGTADKLVPVKQSELLAEALKKAGASAELVVIPDAPHTFDLQPKQMDLRPVVIGFFDKHLKAGQ